MKANKFFMLKCELPFQEAFLHTLLKLCCLFASVNETNISISHIGESISILLFSHHIYFLYSVLHFTYTEALVPETERIFIFTDYKGTMFVDTTGQMHI